MEQVAQPAKEFDLDAFFARQQLVQRAIPLLEPVKVYPHATLLLPVSQNPLSITSTDKITLHGHDTQPFDVTWMTDAANRNPVVNLKDLSSITPKGQKQYSIGEAKTDGGTSG